MMKCAEYKQPAGIVGSESDKNAIESSAECMEIINSWVTGERIKPVQT